MSWNHVAFEFLQVHNKSTKSQRRFVIPGIVHASSISCTNQTVTANLIFASFILKRESRRGDFFSLKALFNIGCDQGLCMKHTYKLKNTVHVLQVSNPGLTFKICLYLSLSFCTLTSISLPQSNILLPLSHMLGEFHSCLNRKILP